MNWLAGVFAHVCGQVHCWSPGGVLMPVCERCVGLYVGVVASAVLVVLLRPKSTDAMLWVNGLMMLVMIPFGYHLLPHGAAMRTVTGFLFGVGLFYYALLIPAQVVNVARSRRIHWAVWVGTNCLAACGVVLAASSSSRVVGEVLAATAFLGLFVLIAMLLVNVAVVMVVTFRCEAVRSSG